MPYLPPKDGRAYTHYSIQVRDQPSTTEGWSHTPLQEGGSRTPCRRVGPIPPTGEWVQYPPQEGGSCTPQEDTRVLSVPTVGGWVPYSVGGWIPYPPTGRWIPVPPYRKVDPRTPLPEGGSPYPPTGRWIPVPRPWLH